MAIPIVNSNAINLQHRDPVSFSDVGFAPKTASCLDTLHRAESIAMLREGERVFH